MLQLFKKEKMSNWEDVEIMKKYLQDQIDNTRLVVHKKMKVFRVSQRRNYNKKRKIKRGRQYQQHHCCVEN